MNTETAALVEKLRQASRGRDEWRVQDEKGSYWIAFAHGDGYTLDPEREAREWLADQQKNNPGHAKARGTVACVQVQTQAQELMQEAAAEIEAGENALAAAGELVAELRAEVDRLRAALADDPMLKLVADIRWALGDNGKRMQPELVQYAAQLKAHHDTAIETLRQIAAMPRRTREQRLAKSCVALLDLLGE